MKVLARLLHSSKCVIIDDQRGHYFLDVHVLEHGLVVEHLLDGVQLGLVLPLLPLGLPLELLLVDLPLGPRQLGVHVGIPRLDDPPSVVGGVNVPVHDLSMATVSDHTGVCEVTVLESEGMMTLKPINFCAKWVFFAKWDRVVKVWVL